MSKNGKSILKKHKIIKKIEKAVRFNDTPIIRTYEREDIVWILLLKYDHCCHPLLKSIFNAKLGLSMKGFLFFWSL